MKMTIVAPSNLRTTVSIAILAIGVLFALAGSIVFLRAGSNPVEEAVGAILMLTGTVQFGIGSLLLTIPGVSRQPDWS